MSYGLGAYGTSGWGLDISSPLPNDPAVPIVTVSPDPTLGILDTTPITVDVTYAGSGLSVIIMAEFPEIGQSEVVYDGTTFAAFYRNSQTSMVPITNGFRFTVLRTPKWPPTVLRLNVVPNIPL